MTKEQLQNIVNEKDGTIKELQKQIKNDQNIISDLSKQLIAMRPMVEKLESLQKMIGALVQPIIDQSVKAALKEYDNDLEGKLDSYMSDNYISGGHNPFDE